MSHGWRCGVGRVARENPIFWVLIKIRTAWGLLLQLLPKCYQLVEVEVLVLVVQAELRIVSGVPRAWYFSVDLDLFIWVLIE